MATKYCHKCNTKKLGLGRSFKLAFKHLVRKHSNTRSFDAGRFNFLASMGKFYLLSQLIKYLENE